MSSVVSPKNDYAVPQAPDDTISSMEFSPGNIQMQFLAVSSWDNKVRLWEIQQTSCVPKAMQQHDGPVLDVSWSDCGSKLFTCGADKMAKMWDLNSNQFVQIAQHDGPIKSCHWIKAPNYSCLMTGSWDKTLRFWDSRQPNPMGNFSVPERVYSVDMKFPLAVVSTANRGLYLYKLENQPQELSKVESPLKYQHRCVSIFKGPNNLPNGFAVGSIEGRVAIQYLQATDPKQNFTFKCHRGDPPQPLSYGSAAQSGSSQDIFPVNCIAFHPEFNTLATVGSDGKFSFWDKDARTRLKTSESCEQPISWCSINSNGRIFAYALGYDWSKGHEFFNPQQKPRILLRQCHQEMQPTSKK